MILQYNMGMKNVAWIYVAMVVLVVAGSAFLYLKPTWAPSGENSTSTPSGNNSSSTPGTVDGRNSLKVSVQPNATLKSPFNFSGEARGWYFEGSFPVELLDGNGNRIVQGLAQAQGEWTTPGFVPFKGTLTFATPQTATGTLVFKVDNPSDMRQYDYEFRMPIKFDLTNPTIEVKVLFSNQHDADTDCGASQSFTRIIPKTSATARAALTELLKGPTDYEKNVLGAFTSINPGVKIQSLTIQSGTARADFDSTLEFQVGGSCRVSAIRSQIINTLKQFSTVQNVIISIDGRTQDILQP